MTPNLLRELKEVHLCTSPPSSAITPTTATTKHRALPMTDVGGGRAIDRYSPHLRDPLRSKPLNPVPPQSPITTRPSNSPIHIHHINPKRSSKKNKKACETKKQTTTQLISPASSRRHLLSNESKFPDEFITTKESIAAPSAKVLELSRFQSSAKIEEISVVLPVEMERFQSVKVEKSNETDSTSSSSSFSSASTSSSTTSKPQEQQIVVLRVSLHCKGCEGKVRKHISKMEGVKSFTTDLVNKKVTVVGDVTPLGVLNSISKVKNAQLWPPKPPAH